MKLLLVDDQLPIRRSLRQLLELSGEFQVIGEGTNGAEAVDLVEVLKPDIVLMDVQMPVMNGIEATRMIKERHPDVEVLALTAFGDMGNVSSMVKAGAAGYLLKGGRAEELLESLRAVGEGRGAIDKELSRGVLTDMAKLYRNEQERAEALAELDRMKREFISVVSHELRTPLTFIKGGVNTVQKNWDRISEEQKLEFLESISERCDVLHRMVDQILTVSGLQRGGLGLKPTVFSLGRIAKDVCDDFQEQIQRREIHLQLEDVQACGDEQRVKGVVYELVRNALQHTKEDVYVEVDSGERFARLRVIDDGPGIEPATVRRLLEEPFSQVDTSNTREQGGLGLSLYTAKQVLLACGGRLEVETGPDRGSTFTALLPRPSTEDASP